MNWQSIVENLGVFGIIGGLITFLMRSYFSKYFDQEVEKFKSSLRLEYFQQESLHAKRIDVICELFSRMVELQDLIDLMTRLLKAVNEDYKKEEIERINTTWNAYSEMRLYFNKNEILFSDEISKIMTEFIKKNFSVIFKYQLQFEFDRTDPEEKKKIFRIQEEIPEILHKLKSDFRGMIGVEGVKI